MNTLDVVYEPTKTGWGVAYVPKVPNANLTELKGTTREETDSPLREEIEKHLTRQDGQPTTDIQGVITEPAELRRVDRPFRVTVFTNTYDWLGPATILLSAWYFSAQLLVAWVFTPPYNFFSNAISDLGATGCLQQGYDFCSPRWIWMDLSIGVLGAAMIFGSILIFTEFRFSGERRERMVALIGFVLLAISGFGAILVASVPENLNGARWHLHTVGTATTIGAGQLGILILGLVLRSIPDWLREFMIVTSLMVLLGAIAYVFYTSSPHPFGFGPGALERIIQYPQALWLMLFGFYISRNHYQKQVTGNYFKFQGAKGKPDKGAFLWAIRSEKHHAETLVAQTP